MYKPLFLNKSSLCTREMGNRNSKRKKKLNQELINKLPDEMKEQIYAYQLETWRQEHKQKMNPHSSLDIELRNKIYERWLRAKNAP